MKRGKSTAKRQAAAILANPEAFREPAAGPAGGMTAEELAALNLAWQRRCERIPANFQNYESYLQAVSGGLLEAEPCGTYKQLSERELRQQISAAKTEAFPAWKPRPAGGTKDNTRALAGWYARFHDDDED